MKALTGTRQGLEKEKSNRSTGFAGGKQQQGIGITKAVETRSALGQRSVLVGVLPGPSSKPVTVERGSPGGEPTTGGRGQGLVGSRVELGHPP